MLENFPHILAMARTGDGAAIQKLIEFYWNNLARFLGRYNLGDAGQDVLQEFFIFLIQKNLLAKSKADSPIQLRNYLLSCLHWHVLSVLPKEKIRSAELSLDTPEGESEGWARFAFSESTESQVLKNLDVQSLREAILDLRLEYRRVIQLHLDGYTHREIADILGIPQNTASSSIRRAKEELRAHLVGRGIGS